MLYTIYAGFILLCEIATIVLSIRIGWDTGSFGAGILAFSFLQAGVVLIAFPLNAFDPYR